MKRVVFLSLLLIVSLFIAAHTINYNNAILRPWQLEKGNKTIYASFVMLKLGDVYLENLNGKITHFPLSNFSAADQEFAIQRNELIKDINFGNHEKDHSEKLNFNFGQTLFIIMVFLILVFLTFYFILGRNINYLKPILIMGTVITLYGFTHSVMRVMKTSTSPAFIDSAFAPFKPDVNTHFDGNYFYVETKGNPKHPMMNGISNWQQQVPIPQCYTGTNYWSIPLNPVKATTPVPVNSSHFLRGAVALAANGIAIFNPYTNTGVDAYLDGQLDQYGGHCGRADDYHYHIAPVFLDSISPEILPIAFALDGYAIYASREPNGTSMANLDVNHGHIGGNGVYHYHGSASAPYMIGNMVGVVTEDSTKQIIPQAAAKPIRPAGAPLAGALITSCVPNGTNTGYTLNYTKGGQNYSVVFSWTTNGVYTFRFISPTATTNSTYNGFIPCVSSTSTISEIAEMDNSILMYPNPSNGNLYFKLNNKLLEKEIEKISIYNLSGELVYENDAYKPMIDLKNLRKGIYMVNIGLTNLQLTKRLVIE